jgi:hypothetical protein
VYRLAYNDDVVAFKMGRLRGARSARALKDSQLTYGDIIAICETVH